MLAFRASDNQLYCCKYKCTRVNSLQEFRDAEIRCRKFRKRLYHSGKTGKMYCCKSKCCEVRFGSEDLRKCKKLQEDDDEGCGCCLIYIGCVSVITSLLLWM